MTDTNWKNCGYCWMGSARYTYPLDPTADKKWRALADLGIEMVVIGFAAGYRPRRFDQQAHFYLLPQFPLSLLRYATALAIMPALALWLVLRGRARVLIAQSPYEGMAAAWVKHIGRLFGKQVILIVENHGDFEASVFMQRRVRLVRLYRWLMKRSARYALDQADLLRSISGTTHRQLQEWAPGKPIEQFMTWTDADVFFETERERPLSQTQDIVYAGVLTPLKGVHFLLDAFARIASEIPDSRLWLVGKAENVSYARELQQQVSHLQLEARVIFVGQISQQELAQYMGRGRVLVLPSLSEGLGRVVIEAMMCGTPVIGSRVGGIPDLIEEGTNGYLVPPGDVDYLAETLRRVLNDPDIEAVGQRARNFALQFFSTETFVNGYRRLFEQAGSRCTR